MFVEVKSSEGSEVKSSDWVRVGTRRREGSIGSIVLGFVGFRVENCKIRRLGMLV